MRDGPALYGENVGETIVEFLAQRWDEIPFEWHTNDSDSPKVIRISTICND
jgi:hypothetical protein